MDDADRRAGRAVRLRVRVGRQAPARLCGLSLQVGFAGLLRRPWREDWPPEVAVAVALLLAAALDDWVSHALGWPTPLDMAWHVLPRWQVLVLLTGLAAGVWVVLGASRHYRS